MNSNRACGMRGRFTDEDLNGRSSRGPFNSRYEFVPQFSYLAPSGRDASAPSPAEVNRGNTGMNLGGQTGFVQGGGYGYQPPQPGYMQQGYGNPAYVPQGYAGNSPNGYYPIQNQGVGNAPVVFNPPLYQGIGPPQAGYNNMPYQGGPIMPPGYAPPANNHLGYVPPGYIPPGYNNPNFQ